MQLFPYPVEMLWNSSFSLVTIPTAFPCLLHAVPYTVCRTTPQLPATALAKDSTSQQQLPVSCDAIMFLYKVGGGEKEYQYLNAHQENSTPLLDVLSFAEWFEPNESAYLKYKNLLSHRRFQKCQNPELPSLTVRRIISPTHSSAQADCCIHRIFRVSGPSSSRFDSAGIRRKQKSQTTHWLAYTTVPFSSLNPASLLPSLQPTDKNTLLQVRAVCEVDGELVNPSFSPRQWRI